MKTEEDLKWEVIKEKSIKIMNLFEELLERYDITIPDDDRENRLGEARIYGLNYYFLADKICDILDEEIS
jgi:hypothetical protein